MVNLIRDQQVKIKNYHDAYCELSNLTVEPKRFLLDPGNLRIDFGEGKIIGSCLFKISNDDSLPATKFNFCGVYLYRKSF